MFELLFSRRLPPSRLAASLLGSLLPSFNAFGDNIHTRPIRVNTLQPQFSAAPGSRGRE